MITTLWLKTFCTLVDVAHFTKTSEKLFMTQSGVSQHIKKLERQLGTALLIREGKSFSLTEAGSKLYLHGQELLKNTDELVSLIKEDDPLVGTVKISSPGSVGLKLYSHLLDLQECHPNLIIDYIFAPNSLVEQYVNERKINIGLVTELSNTSKLMKKEIALEPLVLVTHKEISTINWNTLMALGFISHPDAEHHANLLLKENFAQFEHVDKFRHKGFSNQISLILEPVSRGIGFTVLPLYAVKAFHKKEQIQMHPLENPVSEPLFLCTNHHAFETNRTKHIKVIIEDFLKGLLA